MRERTSPRRQPRPVYFTREQLDELCERIIVGFCMERYGQELTPVPTEALLQLLEEHAHDVDQLAELPEGVTCVFDEGPTEIAESRAADLCVLAGRLPESISRCRRLRSARNSAATW